MSERVHTQGDKLLLLTFEEIPYFVRLSAHQIVRGRHFQKVLVMKMLFPFDSPLGKNVRKIMT